MTGLEEARKTINACDRIIVAAMVDRLAAVRAVGEYKRQNKLPIYQPEREREILARIAESVADADQTAAILELYRFIMQQSRNIQMRQCIPNNIVLIGFMACGKTTVGKELAKISGYEFVDTDDEIVITAGEPISEIFAKNGEAVFRETEAEVVTKLSEQEHCIIACGGGVVLAEQNVSTLRRKGLIVWLRLSVDIILARLENDRVRPLTTGRTAAELTQLFNSRISRYEKAADIIIDADGKDIRDICVEILAKSIR